VTEHPSWLSLSHAREMPKQPQKRRAGHNGWDAGAKADSAVSGRSSPLFFAFPGGNPVETAAASGKPSTEPPVKQPSRATCSYLPCLSLPYPIQALLTPPQSTWASRNPLSNLPTLPFSPFVSCSLDPAHVQEAAVLLAATIAYSLVRCFGLPIPPRRPRSRLISPSPQRRFAGLPFHAALQDAPLGNDASRMGLL
jgi:hypothetical protein